MKLKLDWFLVGMVVAIALAWVWPEPGSSGGGLHPHVLTKAGVTLIFFLHGLLLSFADLRKGTMQWPVHMVVQGCTFLIFPILGLVLLAIPGLLPSPGLRLGVFLLCALPSTVSSSVALTAAARGNVPVAVFNATLSNLIGVVLTPLWIGLLVTASGQGLPLGKVILDLVYWLVLPLLIGQLMRPWLGAWSQRNKKSVNRVDRGVILFLIYTSFCNSMQRGIWADNGWKMIAQLMVISIGLFFVVLLIARGLSRRFRFSKEDEVTTIFCGSQKTLAAGIPIAQLIFGGDPRMGLILLPIIIYHPLQLIISSVLANRWARTADARLSP